MDNDSYMRQVSDNLRQYRELKGLTREEFTAPLAIDSYYYGTIERAERKININLLIKICETYKVDIHQFLPTMILEPEDNTNLLESIKNNLDKRSNKQLLLIEKFINDIAAHI